MWRLYHERQEKKSFKMSIVLMLRDLEPGERARMIAELTSREFDIPYSNKKAISKTTIYEWLKEYRNTKDRAGALLDKERSDREIFRRLTKIQKDALVQWRTGNKYRTIAELREELMEHEETRDVRDPDNPGKTCIAVLVIMIDDNLCKALHRLSSIIPIK